MTAYLFLYFVAYILCLYYTKYGYNGFGTDNVLKGKLNVVMIKSANIQV